MDKKLELAQKMIITAGKKYQVSMIGDNFIGFKFAGDHKDLWNGLIEDFQNQGVDFSFLNTGWLRENGLDFVEYNHGEWV